MKVAAAIASYRSDRSPDVLLVRTLYALGATLAVAVLFFALRRVYRWLDALATRRLAARIEGLEKESIQRPALQPGAGNAFQPAAAAKATGGRLAPPPRRR
jgi:hypothetical protein